MQFAIALTVIAGVVDAISYRIPDLITCGGIILALTVAAISGLPEFAHAVWSATIGGAVFWVSRLFSGGKLGYGDVKLSAMVGANSRTSYLGPQGISPESPQKWRFAAGWRRTCRLLDYAHAGTG
jgi:prepilin signal peptidase PulO-like enzyme (type II secretory pathway)